MKRLWASGILLVLLLILCGLGYSTAQSSSHKMTEGLSRLRAEIYNGNYSSALAVSRSLQHVIQRDRFGFSQLCKLRGSKAAPGF